MKSIILASASPRRKELLELAGIDFKTVVSHCEEDIPEMPPEEYVLRLSEMKCMAAVKEGAEGIVIGADTIVYFEGQILGKPRDPEDAFRMLASMSGHTHAVYTGVTLYDTEIRQKTSFYERTEVTFYPVSDEQIRRYVATGEPMDKAGAYGIQGKGVFLVQKIHGDYSNVVGLPLAHLLRVLEKQDFA